MQPASPWLALVGIGHLARAAAAFQAGHVDVGALFDVTFAAVFVAAAALRSDRPVLLAATLAGVSAVHAVAHVRAHGPTLAHGAAVVVAVGIGAHAARRSRAAGAAVAAAGSVALALAGPGWSVGAASAVTAAGWVAVAVGELRRLRPGAWERARAVTPAGLRTSPSE